MKPTKWRSLERRPVSIMIIGVSIIVFGFLELIGCLTTTMFSPSNGLGLGVGLVFVSVFIAYGLFRTKRWSWLATMALSIISAVTLLTFSIIFNPSLFSVLPLLMIPGYGFIIYYQP
jgi:CHASE2 domain-containing sensor protein